MLSDQDLKASNLKAQSSQQITYNQKWQIKYDLPEAATVGTQTLMCNGRGRISAKGVQKKIFS